MVAILWPLSVLFCFVLSAKWLFWKTVWFLGLAKIFSLTCKMVAIPKHCYVWQLVYSYDVNLLQFCCKWRLLCWTSISIKRSRLTISIYVWRAEALSSSWLVNLPSRMQYSRECGETWRFHVIGILSSGFFLFLLVSSSLICVVPWATAWIFTFNLKALTLLGFFNIFGSYTFCIKIIHPFVNLILLITLRSIQ